MKNGGNAKGPCRRRDPPVRSASSARATDRRRSLERDESAVLEMNRLRMLTIHDGRHTFISHALAGGGTLAEVRDAAGHASVSITSAYLHVAVDGDEATGKLF